jgi:hypothetical protein
MLRQKSKKSTLSTDSSKKINFNDTARMRYLIMIIWRVPFLWAPLENSHVPRLPICCDAGKALSPTVGLEALPWREQRRQRTASGKSFKPKHFWF